jgi:hypothetical protein
LGLSPISSAFSFDETSFMTAKKLIGAVLIWVILTIVNYYLPAFFMVIFWAGLLLGLLALLMLNLVRIFKDGKTELLKRSITVSVFIALFILTLFASKTKLLIEKADWLIFYDTRSTIVAKVITGKITPNASDNDRVCELPFEFPVVSHAGNDIVIDRNNLNGKTTVTFWARRSFASSSSTYFVYTDDPEQIKLLEKKIINAPERNWKIEENWYRTSGYVF